MEMWKFSNFSLVVLELNYAEKHMAGHPDKAKIVLRIKPHFMYHDN